MGDTVQFPANTPYSHIVPLTLNYLSNLVHLT